MGGVRVTLPEAMQVSTPSWLLLALLLIPALHRLEGPAAEARRTTWLTWAAAALGVTLLHLAGTALVTEWLTPTGLGVKGALAGLLALYFVPDLMTVVAIFALWSGFQRRRREDAFLLDRARNDAAVAEARFETLKGRLRPDFIFNTLNASTGLVASGRPEDGAEAISAPSYTRPS